MRGWIFAFLLLASRYGLADVKYESASLQEKMVMQLEQNNRNLETIIELLNTIQDELVISNKMLLQIREWTVPFIYDQQGKPKSWEETPPHYR